MALEKKIPCNGIKPSKSEVYTLAAELAETEDIFSFSTAVKSSMLSYDYHYDYHYYDYYNDYYYDYHYDYDDYDYYHNYNHLTKEQKVISLLFLAAMYS